MRGYRAMRTICWWTRAVFVGREMARSAYALPACLTYSGGAWGTPNYGLHGTLDGGFHHDQRAGCVLEDSIWEGTVGPVCCCCPSTLAGASLAAVYFIFSALSVPYPPALDAPTQPQTKAYSDICCVHEGIIAFTVQQFCAYRKRRYPKPKKQKAVLLRTRSSH